MIAQDCQPSAQDMLPCTCRAPKALMAVATLPLLNLFISTDVDHHLQFPVQPPADIRPVVKPELHFHEQPHLATVEGIIIGVDAGSWPGEARTNLCCSSTEPIITEKKTLSLTLCKRLSQFSDGCELVLWFCRYSPDEHQIRQEKRHKGGSKTVPLPHNNQMQPYPSESGHVRHVNSTSGSAIPPEVTFLAIRHKALAMESTMAQT